MAGSNWTSGLLRKLASGDADDDDDGDDDDDDGDDDGSLTYGSLWVPIWPHGPLFFYD